MKRPFAYFTIPMLLGIVFYYYIEINLFLVVLLFFLTIIVYLINLRLNNSNIVNIFISFLLIGIILGNLKANNSKLIKYANTPVELEGIIKDVKKIKEEESKYIFWVNGVNYNGINEKAKEKVVLNIIGERKLEIGDKIHLKGTLKEPSVNTNPKLFNYRLNLLTENIYTTITIKDYSIVNIEKTKLNFFDSLKKASIKKVENIFDNYLTEKNSSMMKSIVLGKSSYLDQESINDFRNLGLSHILAVSGLHIGIITGLLIYLFAYIGINRKINTVLTIIIIWFYAYIIGSPVSVIRANIMFTLLLLSRLWALPYDSINTLFIALFILMIINPFCIFSIGLQLSFVATFFIIYLTPKISMILYPSRNNIIKSLVGIISVQIGLFPIQAYYFNRVPIIGVFTNLILVPIISISLVLSMVLVSLSFIDGIIIDSIGILLNFLLDIQFRIVNIFAYFPYLNLKLASPSIIEILIYYLFIFIIFGTISLKNLNKGVSKSIILYLLLLVAINSYFISINEGIDVLFIDVGQGDSILIKALEGNYLIDTGGNIFGSFDIGENILLPLLEKAGIFKLKGVFITHYDADHCKSLPYLIDNIKIENIYLGYERDGNELYENIKESAFSKNIPLFILKKGDKLRLDKNTNIYIIGPNENLLKNQSIKDNDLSLVLLLNYYDRNILFTGDVESIGEENIIHSLNGRVDFLKVPHHGSKTSSKIELLEKTKPKIGFISVGRNNSFGHPHQEIINRYKDYNVELYRTDELGMIRLNMEDYNYKITYFLKEKLSILYIIRFYGLGICYIISYCIVSYVMVKYFILFSKEMEIIEL